MILKDVLKLMYIERVCKCLFCFFIDVCLLFCLFACSWLNFSQRHAKIACCGRVPGTRSMR